MAAAKKPKLGRGLDALLGLDTSPAERESNDAGSLRQLPVGAIQPGRYQPRTGMDPERLQELADSIRAQGLIQPIVVRPIGPDRYEIIAGERRWRAAQLADLSEVPAVVREVPDQATVAMALIENIQREDLNPLEEAAALKRLIDEFHLTHQQAAEAVGRSRAAVTNLLRLLDLSPEIKQLLDTRKLEMGHARALLTLKPEIARKLALAAAEGGWSVRQLEEHARQAHGDVPAARGNAGAARAKAANADPNVVQLEQDLGEKLGARVAIQQGRGGRGKLVIEYFSLDELDGIIARIR
jgi:ParB family transcriptional regulator, chromosome partitioning protein